MNSIEIFLDTQLYSWQDAAETEVPEQYRYWVNLEGSLTEALRERADDFSVSLIAQENLDIVWPADSNNPPVGCFSRKVLLMNQATPWVAAHTLIPHFSLNNGLEALTKLENKPLGELLFASPNVRKTQRQVCKTSTGWARRALYFLHEQPLLVSEFFLSGLIEHERQRDPSLFETHSS